MKGFPIYIGLFLGLTSCYPFNETTFYDQQRLMQQDSAKIVQRTLKSKELNWDHYIDTIFPNSFICSLTSIEKLGINNRMIKAYKEDPKQPVKITVSNSFDLDTSCLNSLISLKSLWIDGIYFRSFPIELSQLKSLEKLSLMGSDLKQLPSDLRVFKNLKELNLDFSKFNVPDTLILPSTLKKLTWGGNKELKISDEVRLKRTYENHLSLLQNAR